MRDELVKLVRSNIESYLDAYYLIYDDNNLNNTICGLVGLQLRNNLEEYTNIILNSAPLNFEEYDDNELYCWNNEGFVILLDDFCAKEDLLNIVPVIKEKLSESEVEMIYDDIYYPDGYIYADKSVIDEFGDCYNGSY